MATESFFRNMVITEDTYEKFWEVMNSDIKVEVEDHSHIVKEITGDNAAGEFLKFTDAFYGKNKNDSNE